MGFSLKRIPMKMYPKLFEGLTVKLSKYGIDMSPYVRMIMSRSVLKDDAEWLEYCDLHKLPSEVYAGQLPPLFIDENMYKPIIEILRLEAEYKKTRFIPIFLLKGDTTPNVQVDADMYIKYKDLALKSAIFQLTLDILYDCGDYNQYMQMRCEYDEKYFDWTDEVYKRLSKSKAVEKGKEYAKTEEYQLTKNMT